MSMIIEKILIIPHFINTIKQFVLTLLEYDQLLIKIYIFFNKKRFVVVFVNNFLNQYYTKINNSLK
ncbi:MAG: hypothetical protein JXB50_16375 [Spirochaetes bacterium]|nr:hypothetical protein [Spirochaetota bacterium]